jgi:hypothetical protein
MQLPVDYFWTPTVQQDNLEREGKDRVRGRTTRWRQTRPKNSIFWTTERIVDLLMTRT